MRDLFVVVPLSLVILKCIITCPCLVRGTATLLSLICLMWCLIVWLNVLNVLYISLFPCFLRNCLSVICLCCPASEEQEEERSWWSRKTSLTTPRLPACDSTRVLLRLCVVNIFFLFYVFECKYFIYMLNKCVISFIWKDRHIGFF